MSMTKAELRALESLKRKLADAESERDSWKRALLRCDDAKDSRVVLCDYLLGDSPLPENSRVSFRLEDKLKAGQGMLVEVSLGASAGERWVEIRCTNGCLRVEPRASNSIAVKVSL